jgi:hypothetical protein
LKDDSSSLLTKIEEVISNNSRVLYKQLPTFPVWVDMMGDLTDAPFDIQVPSSLRDPTETTFSIEELEYLETVDDARNVALGYLHDHEKFASIWNSDKVHPERRRLMRKLVQIQTINAVCNGFERKIFF